MKWQKHSDGSVASPFIVPERSNAQKTIWFVSDYLNEFEEGKWDIKIVCYQNGQDFRKN